MLEADAKRTIPKLMREAKGRQREVAISVRDGYSGIGSKLRAVMGLASAWSAASHGSDAEAREHLLMRLMAALDRALDADGEGERVASVVSQDPALQAELLRPAHSAVGTLIFSLARKASGGKRVTLLDWLVGARGFRAHVPFSLPQHLVRERGVHDHTAVLLHVVGSAALNPRLAPPAANVPPVLTAPHLRLHLPTITSALCVMLTHRLHSVARGLRGSVLGDASLPAPFALCPPHSALQATHGALLRVAHSLSLQESALPGTRSSQAPPLAAVQAVPWGVWRSGDDDATTPTHLMLRWLDRVSTRVPEAPPPSALPPLPSWREVGDWALRHAEEALRYAETHGLPSASPSSMAGVSADSQAASTGAGHATMPTGWADTWAVAGGPDAAPALRAGVAALTHTQGPAVDVHVQAVMAMHSAIALGTAAESAVLLAPGVAADTPLVKASKVDPPQPCLGWLAPQSALDVLRAARSCPIASCMLLEALQQACTARSGRYEESRQRQAQQMVEGLPTLATWHPSLTGAVMDVLRVVVVHHIAAAAGSEEHVSLRGSATGEAGPITRLLHKAQTAITTLTTLGQAQCVLRHLAGPAWNPCGEFVRQAVANAVQRTLAPPVAPGLVMDAVLVLGVSRGDGGTSRKCFGPDFAMEHPRAMAQLYQLSVRSRMAESPPPGPQAGMWRPAGLLGFGADPSQQAAWLWGRLLHSLQPCSDFT